MIYLYLFILGSVFASFLYVYVTRKINGESFVKPRSHCDSCKHPLKWFELIPIVSYIALKGKCRYCHKKIDKYSFIVEILTGLLFVIVYLVYGFSIKTLIGLILVLEFISICISDFKYMQVLDELLVIGLALIIILVYFDGGVKMWYLGFMQAVFAFVLMFLIKVLGDYMFNKESLGGGDIKLSFLMGYLLPYQLFLVALIIGSTTALPYAFYINKKKTSEELAFGPFLMIGLLIAFLFQNDIINMINSLIIK